MEYRNNQYIKLNLSIEEISKIRLIIDDKNKLIEDLEIGIDEPNIIICYGGNKINYENIYYSVRIIITDYMTLYNRWREIPEQIEYIIVYGRIYKNNRNKFNFIEYNDDERQRIILREMIEEERINEINDEGNTVLMILCRKNMIEEIKKIIVKMDKKMIDNTNNNKKTALHIASEEKNMEIVEILIKYMSMKGINKSDKEDNTALIILCMIQQEEMAIKVMMKMSKEGINKYIQEETTNKDETVLNQLLYMLLIIYSETEKCRFHTNDDIAAKIEKVIIADAIKILKEDKYKEQKISEINKILTMDIDENKFSKYMSKYGLRISVDTNEIREITDDNIKDIYTNFSNIRKILECKNDIYKEIEDYLFCLYFEHSKYFLIKSGVKIFQLLL